jgi:nucleotide-binding universal stress UspA family protein
MKQIVVGIDGSKSSYEALHEAARLARLEGAKLRLVTAWHVPSVSQGGAFAFPLADMRGEYERDAQAIVDAGVAELRKAGNGVAVDEVVREGHAAKVLLDEAEDADLLVVGNRGHGGFAELLLGSVSHECARHASCPVLIVHRHGQNGSRDA